MNPVMMYKGGSAEVFLTVETANEASKSGWNDSPTAEYYSLNGLPVPDSMLGDVVKEPAKRGRPKNTE